MVDVVAEFSRCARNDPDYVQALRKWLLQCVTALMVLGTFHDHRFVLNHMLRSVFPRS
jgi:hypothetical protein